MAVNYRPVSLTCILCKVIEMLICDTIVKYLKAFDLIRRSQHGFMRGKSTLANLLMYLEELTKLMDEGHSLDIIYLDFSKAFDKVPVRRLLNKCTGLGIQINLLAWIEKWLVGHKQRVVLNREASSWGEICSGVVQVAAQSQNLPNLGPNSSEKDSESDSGPLPEYDSKLDWTGEESEWDLSDGDTTLGGQSTTRPADQQKSRHPCGPPRLQRRRLDQRDI